MLKNDIGVALQFDKFYIADSCKRLLSGFSLLLCVLRLYLEVLVTPPCNFQAYGKSTLPIDVTLSALQFNFFSIRFSSFIKVILF